MYSISKLAQAFGLSRGTLLHYDKVGLLKAGSRSPAGYRQYTEQDRERLAAICAYREMGLSLEAIARLLDSPASTRALLEDHAHFISQQISQLQKQQCRVLALLQQPQLSSDSAMMDKAQWVAILRNCGMSDDDMWQWHAEFERAQPKAHTQFLQSLGIAEDEIQSIKMRAQALSGLPKSPAV